MIYINILQFLLGYSNYNYHNYANNIAEQVGNLARHWCLPLYWKVTNDYSLTRQTFGLGLILVKIQQTSMNSLWNIETTGTAVTVYLKLLNKQSHTLKNIHMILFRQYVNLPLFTFEKRTYITLYTSITY